MKNYELLYIISNQYTDDEAKQISDKVNQMLLSHEAALGYSENLGKRKLAYPINKVAHGYYVLVEFELADGTKLGEISNWLRLDKEILRAQIIAKKKMTPEEIEKQKQQNLEMKEIEKTEDKADKPAFVEKKPKKEEKKIETKNLDDKLNEILTGDELV